jgi:hypothetical protein
MDIQYNHDSLNEQKKDDEKKKKKSSMASIFVIPESSKYKQHLHKREKETKKALKERDKADVKKAPSFLLKGK